MQGKQDTSTAYVNTHTIFDLDCLFILDKFVYLHDIARSRKKQFY